MGNVTKVSVNSFGTSQFTENFINDYSEESDEGYFLEVDVQCTEKLHELYNNLRFLPERMKTEKIEKLVANLHDKTEYVIHIQKSKQALNNWLVFKKFHRLIKFIQNALLKPYIDMNTGLRKKGKNYFEKDFLSRWIMQFLEKLWKIWEKKEMLNL